MVERLTALMHDEATDLDVPPPPAAAILRAGRRQRRRRRVVEGVAGVAAIGLVAAGVGTIVSRSDGTSAEERFSSASAEAAYSDYGAFSVDKTVHVGNHQVTFPEKIKALYYTSEGVLVRMGDKAITDEPGPSHYTLVRPDGSTKDIDLRMGDRIPGTDPDSPDVAYAEPHGDRWDLVVVNLATGAEIARTTVTGTFTWGGWEAPPVDTAGTRMWALFDTGWMEYDWSTGKTRAIPGTADSWLESAHGRYVAWPGYADTGTGTLAIKDFVGGQEVGSVRLPRTSFPTMSPDGRYVMVAHGFFGDVEHEPVSTVISVDSGKEVTLPGRVRWGWTPDGHALAVDPDDDQVTVCDAATGDCDRIELQIGSGKVKLGGASYES